MRCPPGVAGSLDLQFQAVRRALQGILDAGDNVPRGENAIDLDATVFSRRERDVLRETDLHPLMGQVDVRDVVQSPGLGYLDRTGKTTRHFGTG